MAGLHGRPPLAARDPRRKAPPAPPPLAVDPWRDLAGITYTGGTTGFPKGVPSNHMTEVAYVRDAMEDVFAGHIRAVVEHPAVREAYLGLEEVPS